MSAGRFWKPQIVSTNSLVTVVSVPVYAPISINIKGIHLLETFFLKERNTAKTPKRWQEMDRCRTVAEIASKNGAILKEAKHHDHQVFFTFSFPGNSSLNNFQETFIKKCINRKGLQT